MDMVAYQPLLDQLIPLAREPDFEEIFARLTHEESRNTQFLLKMELKRKCSPCIRSIDMRARHPQSKAFQYGGVQHFLTDEAQEVFQTQLKIYRNHYTMGVYEAVIEDERLHRQQANADDGNSPPLLPSRLDVEAIRFASYHQRREERMHFSSPVRLQLGDQTQIEAKTSNISVGGLKLQVDTSPLYQPGDTCYLHFTGLLKEKPANVIRSPIPYQILGEERRDGRTWLKLLRQEDDPELDAYLKGFIDDNKWRYRVSIDYLLSSAQIKGYEQYFLPRMTGLPLFFDRSETPALRYVLKTENNQQELEYWRNERNEEMLAGLFGESRLKALLAQPGPRKETWIYCFTHTLRSHIYFFSASREELEQTGLRNLFFSVGAKRPSWRVYKLELEPADLPLTQLANLLPPNLTPAYQEQLTQWLSELGYVGLLQAVDDEELRRDYLLSQPDPAMSNANELQIFAHRKEVASFELELLHYAQLRKELRYSHKTAVVVKKEEERIIGWTRDISTQGLQIELEQPLACEKGELIHLALPKLQTLSKDMDLSALPYRIVNSNATRTVLHLCIEGLPSNHVGRQFFSRLIDSNPDKLKATRELRRYPGMAVALRNLYSHHLFTTPLYLSKHQSNRLGAIGMVERPRPLLKLLAECRQDKPYNLTPLFDGERLKTVLLQPLNHVKREDRPKEQQLFISRQLDPQGNHSYDIHLESEFKDAAAKQAYVLKALKRGGFFSVRLFASRTGRPDIDFVAHEMDYIAKYAIHKAKQLEESLWSIIGVCDLMDTTGETLFRLGISLK